MCVCVCVCVRVRARVRVCVKEGAFVRRTEGVGGNNYRIETSVGSELTLPGVTNPYLTATCQVVKYLTVSPRSESHLLLHKVECFSSLQIPAGWCPL